MVQQIRKGTPVHRRPRLTIRRRENTPRTIRILIRSLTLIVLCGVGGWACRLAPVSLQSSDSVRANESAPQPELARPLVDCETRSPRPEQEGLRAGRYRVLLESPGAILCPLDPDAGDCESVELSPEPTAGPGESTYGLVDDDLTVLVVLGVPENSGTVSVASFSIPEGRPIRSYKIPVAFTPAGLFAMLGQVLYVRDCVGAGPGCHADLYPVASRTGRPTRVGFGDTAESALNMYDASELALPGRQWIFVDASGTEVVWMDLNALRVVRRVRIADLLPSQADAEPATQPPWSAENFDPAAGNHARLAGPDNRELHIVYRTNETDARHWQVRLDANNGALLGADEIQICKP